MDVKKITPRGGMPRGGYPVPSAHAGGLHIGGHTQIFFKIFLLLKQIIWRRAISVELIGLESNLDLRILPPEI